MNEITPLTERSGWNIHPDRILSEFTLPLGYNGIYKERPVANLEIRIKKLKKKTKKYNKTFYLAKNGVFKVLGSFPDMNFKQAIEALNSIKTEAKNSSQMSLKSVFELYLKFKCAENSDKTVKKKKSQMLHFFNYYEKPIKSLSHSQIIEIFDRLYANKKHDTVKELFNLIRDVLKFAKIRKFIETNPIGDENWKDHYTLKKSDGHGYLDPQNLAHLKFVIDTIYNYKHNIVVREALIMGLCTALRSQNVRELRKEQIKKDENGNYYLSFEAVETKTKKQQKIGIPTALANWLLNRQNIDFKGLNLVFPATSASKTGILSENTLNLSLKEIKEKNIAVGGPFVFHSFRKIFSSYYREITSQNGDLVDDVGVEKVLFHEVGKIEKIYNKSQEINRTRKILTEWLEILNKIAGYDILGARR
ncbi:tyrosine-type recombinase/integrase [Campylobacter geochelonis]|uniref:Integrase phage family protein n=1 Tax=Campylobacter geochelonis TaxID=1780362 RepID=A0A128EJ23_9BACT|nr:site-specific integrase [Campylobacter geochelonis]QKF71209.1 site-specific tyrosine recombinase, phage integrase family (INT_P4_C domain) [Campylobacter geochelonis]CZE48844.1 integrase phage family protein [Campylobacter geochelonis]